MHIADSKCLNSVHWSDSCTIVLQNGGHFTFSNWKSVFMNLCSWNLLCTVGQKKKKNGPHANNFGPALPEVKKKNLGPARKRNWNLRPSPARPERRIEISARVRPRPAQPETKYKILARANFFFQFRTRQLCLSDFKTGPFSCLHTINVFFLLLIYFSAYY